jgi:glycosyltransferase involved in cell wall biosynthesis
VNNPYNAIWVTWESQRRNFSLSQRLGADLYKLEYNAPRFIRYPVLIIRTLHLLFSSSYSLIFVQNPSLLLSLLVVLYGRWRCTPVVVDAHNSGVYPFEGRRTWATKLSFFLFRNAGLTIVTNQALGNYVKQHGGHACILPDPIPDIPQPAQIRKLAGKFNILFICTWAEDEPYAEVIRAASTVEHGTVIYVTGNSRGKEYAAGNILPDNVVLTGFLPEQQFQEILWSCDAVMDLTTRDNCLVCGAYEAVAAGKPVLLSDTKALRSYFKRGAAFTRNDVISLTRAIDEIRHQFDSLREEMTYFQNEVESVWEHHRRDLQTEIDALMNKQICR